jgi:ubiquinone/menaquinone biosynthesis C-methylase UbiE/uncharacterized protein YbaR (Trm112 family)
MYPEALAALCAPNQSAAPLELETGAHVASDGAVLTGWLRDPRSNRRYPIRDGIADLLGWSAWPDSPAQVANYLPPTAWAYERTWRPHALTLLTGESFGYARELSLITRLMEPERGGLYLDVACSNGLYARALTQAFGAQGGHVVGIDHALPMLREARAFAQRDGLRVSYVRARAQALPFAAQAVAGAAMGGSLNEIGDAAGALREVRRVLAPAGRFVSMNLVAAENRAGRLLQGFLRTGGIQFWPLAQLNQQFVASGLHLRAQWRYRVVVFSLLLPSATA